MSRRAGIFLGFGLGALAFAATEATAGYLLAKRQDGDLPRFDEVGPALRRALRRRL